jgi:hypothetical protein
MPVARAREKALVATGDDTAVNGPVMLFASAALGNLAPLALRWYSEQRITLPGEAIGGLLAFLLLAALAGFFAVFVWNEKTARRAFFVGLAFPYVLSGFIADVQGVARVKRARAVRHRWWSYGLRPDGSRRHPQAGNR